MRYRIEMQNDGVWTPAVRSTPTTLNPERASTYESPEVVFADAKKIQEARPTVAVRIVEADTGMLLWRAGEDASTRPNGGSHAVFLNGSAATPVPVNVDATARRELSAMIAEAQAEFVGGLETLQQELASRKTPRSVDLELALSAAQEILTNLRDLARSLETS